MKRELVKHAKKIVALRKPMRINLVWENNMNTDSQSQNKIDRQKFIYI